MPPRFHEKVCVVIGGNSGIGLASAQAFALEGARVVITGRDPVTLERAARSIGPGTLAIRCDVADLGEIDALMRRIGDEVGHIDVLFVNAGVGAFIALEAVTEQDWDQVHAVNLKGVFFSVQKALALMSKGGSIVLNASIGWRKGIPTGSVYAASKAGVRALGRSFAAELIGRGIRVNVVSPGPIETPIIGRTAGLTAEKIPELREQMLANTPMRRMGEPAEVARAALFLASQEASFITGVDLLVDGGAASF